MTSGSEDPVGRAAPPKRERAAVAVAFFVLAGAVGTWPPRVPAIRDRLGLSEGQLGVALGAYAVGLLAGTRVAAWAVARFGAARVVRAGTIALLASLVGPAVAVDLWTLAVAFAIFGLAAGSLDVAINAEAVVVERSYGRPIMSGLHGLFSVGNFAAAVIAGAVAAAGVAPPSHFAGVSIVLAVAAAAGLRGLPPAAAQPAVRARAAGGGRRPPVATVAFLALIGYCAFFAEGAVADWSAVYLRDELGAPAGLAAGGFAGLALAMAAARLAGDSLWQRFGPVVVVRIGGLAAAAGLGLAVIASSPGVSIAGFTLLGAGLGAVVPIAFSAAGNVGGDQERTLARVVTVSYAGSVTGPIVIGGLAEVAGLRVVLLAPAALALVIAVGARAVATAGGRPGEPMLPASAVE